MLPDGTTGAKRRGRQEVSNVPPRAVLPSGLHFVCCLLWCFPRSGLPPSIWYFRLVCFASFPTDVAISPTDTLLSVSTFLALHHRGGCCRSLLRLVGAKRLRLRAAVPRCFYVCAAFVRVHTLDGHFLSVQKELKSGVPTAFRYVSRFSLRSTLICSIVWFSPRPPW